MDPEKVLTDICTNAINTDFKTNEFISPNDSTNINTFITNNLSLASLTTIYKQDVQLSWEWIPDSANPSEQEKNVVRFTTNASKPTVAEISRLESDVTGKLKVTAKYSASQLNQDVTNGQVSKELPVTIKGLGTPPIVNTITGYVGDGVNPDIQQEIKGPTQKLPTGIDMNVYKNEVTGFDVTNLPYLTEYNILLGENNGRATQVFIDLVNPNGTPYTGAIPLKATITDATSTRDYTFGTSFSTKDITQTNVKLYAIGETQGLTVRFRFMVKGPSGDREEIDSRVEIPYTIINTSPDTTADLTNVYMRSNNVPVENFTFNKDTTYYNIPIEFKSKDIVISPISYRNAHDIIGLKIERKTDAGLWETAGLNDGWVSYDNDIQNKEWVADWADQAAEKQLSIRSGETITVNPNAGKTLRVTFTVRAQHPTILKTYVIELTKDLPSTNSFLKSISFKDETGKEMFTQKLTDGELVYNFEIPFKTEYLQIVPQFQQSGAFIENDVENGKSGYNPSIGKRDGMPFDKNEWWKLDRPVPDPTKPVVTNQMSIKVNAENQNEADSSNYIFNVSYSKPSTDSSLNKLTLQDNKKGNIAYTPNFHSQMQQGDYYEATVPFSVDYINVSAVPTYIEATHEIVYRDIETGIEIIEPMTRTNASKVTLPILPNLEAYYEIIVRVTAEDMGTTTDYPVRIHRTPPSKEAGLASLVIKGQENNDLSKDNEFAFNTEKLSYAFNVPYEVKKVSFTPAALYDNISAIKLNGYTIHNNATSPLQTLEDSLIPTTFEIEVFPEDVTAPSKIYTITITRQMPSDDARLRGLTVDGVEEFTPIFTPNGTSYSAKIPDESSAIITATVNHPYATLTIRGLGHESGQPTEPINLMEETEVIEIVVTAQDGVTTKTYSLNLTDLNLVELSNNADLASLVVSPGVQTPRDFSPAVTSYSVAVTEETASVTLLAVPADPLATYKVYSGSKEIGDFNGNYAQRIEDGENELSVTVTSPDGTVEKTYEVSVFKNDEENQDVLRPIMPEDVNYELGDPIIVDVSKYARVSAEVFTTLRDEYSDKTIIFQGNDYSLTFKANELSKNIPITAIYDFYVLFDVKSPAKEKLEGVLYEYPDNALIDMIYVTFGYHGDLPGPAALNISFGGRYGNTTLQWHYSNEERNRVDYYGDITTNARGNATIQLTHMSTYIAARARIIGSEDRSGEINLAPGKGNPNTGTIDFFDRGLIYEKVFGYCTGNNIGRSSCIFSNFRLQ